MAHQRIRPEGFGYGSDVTSEEMNQLAEQAASSLDKRAGQTDTVASDVTFTGTVKATKTVDVGGALTVAGAASLAAGLDVAGSVNVHDADDFTVSAKRVTFLPRSPAFANFPVEVRRPMLLEADVFLRGYTDDPDATEPDAPTLHVGQGGRIVLDYGVTIEGANDVEIVRMISPVAAHRASSKETAADPNPFANGAVFVPPTDLSTQINFSGGVSFRDADDSTTKSRLLVFDLTGALIDHGALAQVDVHLRPIYYGTGARTKPARMPRIQLVRIGAGAIQWGAASDVAIDSNGNYRSVSDVNDGHHVIVAPYANVMGEIDRAKYTYQLHVWNEGGAGAFVGLEVVAIYVTMTRRVLVQA